MEGIVEQVRARDVDPVAPKGRGKKDKSRDPMASLEGRVNRLEVAMADTKEGVDYMEQSMEKVVEDLKVQIQDLQEGMQSSPVPVVSHEEFMKVIDMLSSLESRVEILTKHEEKLRQEVAIYKTALSDRIMATYEAPRVEVPKLEVPLGPMTRDRAKRFKEALHVLIRDAHVEEALVFNSKKETKMVHIIKLNPDLDQEPRSF